MEPRSENRILMSINSAQTCILAYLAKLLNLLFIICLSHWKKLQTPTLQVGNSKQSTHFQLEIVILELSDIPTTVSGKANTNHCYCAIVATPSSTKKLCMVKKKKKIFRSSWILWILVFRYGLFFYYLHTLPAFSMINYLLL